VFYKSGPKECCKRAVQTNALNTPFYENVAGILHKGSHEEVFCKSLSTKAERRAHEAPACHPCGRKSSAYRAYRFLGHLAATYCNRQGQGIAEGWEEVENKPCRMNF